MNEITPKNYLYGAILFSIMIVGIVSMLSSLNQAEGNNMADDSEYLEFNHTFNFYDDLNDEVGGIRSSIETSQTNYGIFGVLNSLINSAWQVLKNLFSSFGFVGKAFTGLSDIFGVPTWFGAGISLLIVVMIAFTIWSAIFQKNF